MGVCSMAEDGLFRIFTVDERCLPAVEEVRRMYMSHGEWAEEIGAGKMFGVLIYEGGYLAAFSGTLGGKTVQEGFVPPVFDSVCGGGGYFKREEAEISAINGRIAAYESMGLKGEAGRMVAELRGERRARSRALQGWLFDNYVFVNGRGMRKSLTEIFAPYGGAIPSGSGDCCGPKLLQAALLGGIRPLAMVEWNSANDRFCRPCTQRCRPILEFMLDGLNAERDPELVAYESVMNGLRVVYEDEWLWVVDKPGGLLSVCGKEFLPSVLSMTGGLEVHRLDMDTSGLMLVAKEAGVQRALRMAFERREVYKVYDALLEREMVVGSEGVIDLALRADVANRPRQVVDVVGGKVAVTRYQVVGNMGGCAHVRLFPQTGRTHQLRVHCASAEGLGNAIVGDRLYGVGADGLRLNASVLGFVHPVTGREMVFKCSAKWLDALG